MLAVRKDIAPLQNHISYLDQQIGARSTRRDVAAGIAFASSFINIPASLYMIFGFTTGLVPRDPNIQLAQGISLATMGTSLVYYYHQKEEIGTLESQRNALVAVAANLLASK